jgi:hypothetical protein
MSPTGLPSAKLGYGGAKFKRFGVTERDQSMTSPSKNPTGRSPRAKNLGSKKKTSSTARGAGGYTSTRKKKTTRTTTRTAKSGAKKMGKGGSYSAKLNSFKKKAAQNRESAASRKSDVNQGVKAKAKITVAML